MHTTPSEDARNYRAYLEQLAVSLSRVELLLLIAHAERLLDEARAHVRDVDHEQLSLRFAECGTSDDACLLAIDEDDASV